MILTPFDLARLSLKQTLIFDLDNTIYRETDFLFGAYREIGALFNRRLHINPKCVYDFLVDHFIRHGRSLIFNNLVSEFNVNDLISVDDCLIVLRQYCRVETILPYKFFQDYLTITSDSNHEIYIITNGNPLQQANKIKSIRFGEYRKKLFTIFANQYALKPSRASYDYLLSCKSFLNPIYIGDSTVDSEFAKNCDMDFISVEYLIGSSQ